MPSIPAAPESSTTSNVSGQMWVYNTSTGSPSFGSYSGSITTSSANSFASGFSNGVASGAALGEAIRARRAQDQIHDECMIRKGWKEVKSGASHAAPVSAISHPMPSITPTAQRVSMSSKSSVGSSEKIYGDAKTAWLAEVTEFTVLIYPQYKENHLLWDRLDAAVKKIAKERPLASGPQILLAAQDSLNANGEGAPEPAQGEQGWLIASTYRKAVAGSVVDQNALGIGFMYGKEPFPRDYRRARYWFQKSAIAGDSLGEEGYGTLIFMGAGGTSDRPRGYWWVKKAAAAGDKDAPGMLVRMEAEMSATELQAAQVMQ
jgi:hypothetical protein